MEGEIILRTQDRVSSLHEKVTAFVFLVLIFYRKIREDWFSFCKESERDLSEKRFVTNLITIFVNVCIRIG